jgi:hypothetical protein
MRQPRRGLPDGIRNVAMSQSDMADYSRIALTPRAESFHRGRVSRRSRYPSSPSPSARCKCSFTVIQSTASAIEIKIPSDLSYTGIAPQVSRGLGIPCRLICT